jgi:IS605 OrfB family transposase
MKKRKKKTNKPKKKIKFYTPDLNLSNKFWFPIDKNLKSSSKIIDNTWFNSEYKESVKTNDKLINNINVIKNNKIVIRAKTIKIYFTKKQSNIIKKWFHYYRYVYNLTVRYFRKYNQENKNFRNVRSKIKNLINKTMKDRIQKSKIPSHTIDNAINDVCKAYKTGFSNLKAGNITHFKLRYKKNKSPRETILLESSCFSLSKQRNKSHSLLSKIDKDLEPIISIREFINVDDIFKPNKKLLKNSFCTSIMGDYIKSSESITEVQHDCRLSYHKRLNTFYLYVPEEKIVNTSCEQEDICVLDPGMRCFQTCYTSNGVIEIGNDVSTEIGRLITKMDKYDKKSINNKIRNKYFRINRTLKNKIDELHNKTNSYLCTRYKCIVIGKLSTKNINRKDSSVLSKKTKRILQMLSHYKFRERLKSKCEEYNIKYLEVDESYTSKVCSNCGFYKKDLGSNKRYDCNKCHINIDRDYNACRNILIKNHSLITVKD